LAGLVLVVAGLLQVVLGSRGQLLNLLVGTVLSVAVVAATGWWAFTTRRGWKRWLNVAIAALAAANIRLRFVEVGLPHATARPPLPPRLRLPPPPRGPRPRPRPPPVPPPPPPPPPPAGLREPRVAGDPPD